MITSPPAAPCWPQRARSFATALRASGPLPGGSLKPPMKQQLDLLDVPRNRRTPFLFVPKEYKVQALRECPPPAEMQCIDTPDKAAAYWRAHVPAHPSFNPATGSLVGLIGQTRRPGKTH